MITNSKHPFLIVMKALLMGRTVKVGNDFMCYDDELHKVGFLLGDTGNAVYYADQPCVNWLIEKCEQIPDHDIVGIAADITLQELRPKRILGRRIVE